MADHRSATAAHDAELVGSGAYLWYADGKRVPIAETWRIFRTDDGARFETDADATAVPDFGYAYRATLALDGQHRPTALAMTVETRGHRVAARATFEEDAATVARVVESRAAGAVQRTQTFRMEPGYTVEVHPVLFDGLHIAALDPDAPVPHRRPCLWMDLNAAEIGAVMAARPTVYVIAPRPARYGETYAITRWGNDPETAESLLAIKRHGAWVLPTEFRFTMAGVVYSALLANERWEGSEP